jgi:hypothetical protein
MRLRSQVETQQGRIIGGILAFTGLGMLIWNLLGERRNRMHGHSHVGERSHIHHGLVVTRLLGIVIPFEAAASPALSSLPIAFAASAIGPGAVAGVLLLSAFLTRATAVGITSLALIVGYRIRWAWIERYGSQLTAVVVLVIGALVLLTRI